MSMTRPKHMHSFVYYIFDIHKLFRHHIFDGIVRTYFLFKKIVSYNYIFTLYNLSLTYHSISNYYHKNTDDSHIQSSIKSVNYIFDLKSIMQELVLEAITNKSDSNLLPLQPEVPTVHSWRSPSGRRGLYLKNILSVINKGDMSVC